MQKAPELYIDFCEERIERTILNGPRKQPPSHLEMMAVRHKKPITLPITLMDGTTRNIQVDSASTSREVCQQLAQSIGLKDLFGFGIFITIYDKGMPLGSDDEHIMDALSNCEQYAKEQGVNEKDAAWKLFFRKEIFSPWHDPSLDPLATHLIFKQITRGVSYGEYCCKNEKEIAMLSALQYYAEFGGVMDTSNLRKNIPEYIPKVLLASGEQALNKWESLIHEAFKKSRTIKQELPKNAAREDIVVFGQLNWAMMFSRFFEAVRIGGSKLNNNNVIIAVNWSGVYFVNDQEQVLVSLTVKLNIKIYKKTPKFPNRWN